MIVDLIKESSHSLSAQQIIEHPFLAVEPEVVLVMTENKTHLTMQVVFKGMDKLSVKFEFNGRYWMTQLVVDDDLKCFRFQWTRIRRKRWSMRW